jgi:hypothetical protein
MSHMSSKRARRKTARPKPSPSRRRDGFVVDRIDAGPALGPGVVSASIDDALAAISRQASDLEWPASSSMVVPILPRTRPYPPGYPIPLRTVVPPGIAVGFAIDVGPAFMTVTPELLETWGISVADLAACAIRNVHDRGATIDPREIVRHDVGDIPTEVLQTGRSIGSTLVLAPSEIRRLFGRAPRVFITPMRDLIVGLPERVDAEFAWWLYMEFASLDPNCLGPLRYQFNGEHIVPGMLDVPAPAWLDESPGGTFQLT